MDKLIVKKIAFSVVLSAFIIISPILILDAQGFGFDFEKLKIVKVGGISIKSIIPDINVFINNEYKNKTSSFSRDLLLQKLIPGEYKIKIEKENYHSWEKILSVEEKKVTKAENIYLFLENIPFEINKENIQNFFLSKDKSTILYLTEKQEIISNKNDLVLNSTESKKYFSEINNVEFFPDFKKILIKGKDKQKNIKYYYLELNNPSSLSILKILETAEDFILKDNSILYKTKNQLNEYSLTDKTTEVIKKDINAFSISDYNLYTIEKGVLIRTNTISKNQEILSVELLPIQNYKMMNVSGKILVHDNFFLYVFNENNKKFEQFLKTTEINYDVLSDKIIFNNNSELWLLLLRDFESPFFQKSGSFIFLSRFSSKIENVNWFNNDYFFYTTNNNLYVSEIDNRDNINVFQISQLPVKKLWFDNKEKILYFLSDNKVYTSNKFNPY